MIGWSIRDILGQGKREVPDSLSLPWLNNRVRTKCSKEICISEIIILEL